MKIIPNGFTLWLAALLTAAAAMAADTNQTGETTARLSAVCRGFGIIRPDYNGKHLVLGKTYIVVAKANAGYIFTNWTDAYETVITNHPRLTLVMKTNSVIIANFIKREFPAGRLDGVSTAQLPLTILAAVNAAPPENQGRVLADWIAEAAVLRPSALPSIVATVVSAHPELLAIAVASGVASGSAQVYGVVHAAANIPGVRLAEIIAAAAAASPTDCYQIAQAALDVDPAGGRIILQTIAATVPELTPIIGAAASGVAPLTRNQTLAILSRALTQIHWPTAPAPGNQIRYDYSQP